jgi:hypothetical protein
MVRIRGRTWTEGAWESFSASLVFFAWPPAWSVEGDGSPDGERKQHALGVGTETLPTSRYNPLSLTIRSLRF